METSSKVLAAVDRSPALIVDAVAVVPSQLFPAFFLFQGGEKEDRCQYGKRSEVRRGRFARNSCFRREKCAAALCSSRT